MSSDSHQLRPFSNFGLLLKERIYSLWELILSFKSSPLLYRKALFSHCIISFECTHVPNWVMEAKPMSSVRYLEFCKYSQPHLGLCCPVVMSGIFLGD